MGKRGLAEMEANLFLWQGVQKFPENVLSRNKTILIILEFCTHLTETKL